MKTSGSTIKSAPFCPPVSINEQAFSTLASLSKKTGAAWTAAALNFG
jgi:hypothetical protein